MLSRDALPMALRNRPLPYAHERAITIAEIESGSRPAAKRVAVVLTLKDLLVTAKPQKAVTAAVMIWIGILIDNVLEARSRGIA